MHLLMLAFVVLSSPQAPYLLLPGTLYFVDVSTGSESHSGTSSRVFIKLIGENGEHGEIKLGKKFKKGRLVTNLSLLIFSTKRKTSEFDFLNVGFSKASL